VVVLTLVIAGLGLLSGLVALASARRLSRKLDALTQSYWELRYDYTRLRSQVARLDPEAPDPLESAQGRPEARAETPPVSFVPLSSMRKKE
jgi:hypothetical protein